MDELGRIISYNSQAKTRLLLKQSEGFLYDGEDYGQSCRKHWRWSSGEALVFQPFTLSLNKQLTVRRRHPYSAVGWLSTAQQWLCRSILTKKGSPSHTTAVEMTSAIIAVKYIRTDSEINEKYWKLHCTQTHYQTSTNSWNVYKCTTTIDRYCYDNKHAGRLTPADDLCPWRCTTDGSTVSITTSLHLVPNPIISCTVLKRERERSGNYFFFFKLCIVCVQTHVYNVR